MNMMTYKGYTARIDFDDRDNILVGRLLGIQDLVGFHVGSVLDLYRVFEETVDEYLEACEKIGKLSEKPASGNMLLRVPPEMYAAALIKVKASGKSLNQWASEVLGSAAYV